MSLLHHLLSALIDKKFTHHFAFESFRRRILRPNSQTVRGILVVGIIQDAP